MPGETYKGIPVFVKKKPGYVSLQLFATRMGVSKQSVQKSFSVGKFNKENLLYIRNKPGGKAMTLHVLWESEWVRYIDRWPESKKPKWYLDPYNNTMPFSTASQMAALKRMKDERDQGIQEEEKNKVGSNRGSKSILDMGDANLAEKQLKIEKLQVEMDIQKGNLIEIESACAVMQGAAQATRQGFASLIPRLGPLLAAEDDLHKITQMLEQEFDSVLNSLSEMENYGSTE